MNTFVSCGPGKTVFAYENGPLGIIGDVTISRDDRSMTVPCKALVSFIAGLVRQDRINDLETLDDVTLLGGNPVIIIG